MHKRSVTCTEIGAAASPQDTHRAHTVHAHNMPGASTECAQGRLRSPVESQNGPGRHGPPATRKQWRMHHAWPACCARAGYARTARPLVSYLGRMRLKCLSPLGPGSRRVQWPRRFAGPTWLRRLRLARRPGHVGKMRGYGCLRSRRWLRYLEAFQNRCQPGILGLTVRQDHGGVGLGRGTAAEP